MDRSDSNIAEALTPGGGLPASPMTGYRWVICTLLFLATTINYVDRQILSLLKPILDHQFNWSDFQFGIINGVFSAAYGISVLGFGWLIDRWGTKLGYAISIAAWSLAAMSHALVGSIAGFTGARVALGLSEGGNFPAAVKAVAQWFPKRERALATSLFNSGANIGAVLAPAVIPFLAVKLGWRSAFLFAGAAGFLWLFAWFPLFDYPERSRRVSAAELAFIESDAPDPSGGGGRMTWGAVLKYPQAWSFIVSKFLTDPVWGLLLIWLPDFFKTRGLDIKGSVPLLVSIYSIVTVFSIAGGWLTGFLVGRGWAVTRARKSGLLLFAVAVMPVALTTNVGNWAAVLLLGLAGAAHQAWSATIYTSVSDMFPKRAVATLIGIGTAAGSISGMAVPILTGLILDHFKKGAHAHTGYTILFAFCSVAYLLAFAASHILAPSFEPVAFDTPPAPEAAAGV